MRITNHALPKIKASAGVLEKAYLDEPETPKTRKSTQSSAQLALLAKSAQHLSKGELMLSLSV